MLAKKVLQQKSRNPINWNLSLFNWCNYVLCQAINSLPSFVSFLRNLAARQYFILGICYCWMCLNMKKVVVWLRQFFLPKRKWWGATNLLHLLLYLPAASKKCTCSKNRSKTGLKHREDIAVVGWDIVVGGWDSWRKWWGKGCALLQATLLHPVENIRKKEEEKTERKLWV